MPIKQFSGQWAADEDRLLFRFNTADGREFRFWLTRHITKALIDGSQRVVTAVLAKKFTPETAGAIQEFQQQTAKQTTQFNESYETGGNLVLGEAPILVIGLAMQPEKELMSVDLRLATKQNVNFRIPLAVFQKMILLLDKLQAQAHWGVGLPLPAATETSPGAAAGAAPGTKVH